MAISANWAISAISAISAILAFFADQPMWHHPLSSSPLIDIFLLKGPNGHTGKTCWFNGPSRNPSWPFWPFLANSLIWPHHLRSSSLINIFYLKDLMATLEKPADLTAHPGTPVGHFGQLANVTSPPHSAGYLPKKTPNFFQVKIFF